MSNTLDQALQALAAAEATYNADLASIINIQTAIDTATAPMAPAQAQAVTDGEAYVAAGNAAIAAIQAAIGTVPPAPTS